MSTCLFCQIVAGTVPATIEYQDEQVIAFRDIAPKAPVHLLLVPRKHIERVHDLKSEDETTMGHVIRVAGQLATKFGIEQSGYRLSLNTGPDSGQSVFHLHVHLLGGQKLESMV